jgi:phosphoribosyl-dephospho-CoA transferase
MVVVRRAVPCGNLIPVGVRGSSRSQRFAAFIEPESILVRSTPEDLADHPEYRTKEIPAFAALVIIHPLLSASSLTWGPTGSAGFELASGVSTTTADSDLDLLIRVPERLPLEAAQALMNGLAGLPCRVEAQLETPHGAVSLSEYVDGDRPLLLRTNWGPRMTTNPWEPR